ARAQRARGAMSRWGGRSACAVLGEVAAAKAKFLEIYEAYEELEKNPPDKVRPRHPPSEWLCRKAKEVEGDLPKAKEALANAKAGVEVAEACLAELKECTKRAPFHSEEEAQVLRAAHSLAFQVLLEQEGRVTLLQAQVTRLQLWQVVLRERLPQHPGQKKEAAAEAAPAAACEPASEAWFSWLFCCCARSKC
ncbi:unnamed protein product, partial [Effrenium voratum]